MSVTDFYVRDQVSDYTWTVDSALADTDPPTIIGGYQRGASRVLDENAADPEAENVGPIFAANTAYSGTHRLFRAATKLAAQTLASGETVTVTVAGRALSGTVTFTLRAFVYLTNDDGDLLVDSLIADGSQSDAFESDAGFKTVEAAIGADVSIPNGALLIADVFGDLDASTSFQVASYLFGQSTTAGADAHTLVSCTQGLNLYSPPTISEPAEAGSYWGSHDDE